jgi:carbon monoxide dehydrogenase subunit G
MTMRFEHEFTVPVPVEQAWAVLLDVERVAPCLPGAVLDTVEGDSFTGRLKVKVGPITVTYRGSAAFEDVDKDTHTAVLKASGKEARGPGTAAAAVTVRLSPEGTGTRAAVETSFTVTGRPAQFGRGVMAEVGTRLIDRFAAGLSDLLGEGSAGEPAAGSGADGGPSGNVQPLRRLAAVPSPGETPAQEAQEARRQDVHPAGTTRTSLTPDEEALDLLEVAGVPLLRRLAPAAAVLAGLALLAWLVRRMLPGRGGHRDH